MEWLQVNQYPAHKDILHFHRFAGEGNMANGLCINRNNQMLTVSVTGMEIRKGSGRLVYHDLIAGKTYNQELAFISQPALL